jgi:membrane-bound ClpP family serine protease
MPLYVPILLVILGICLLLVEFLIVPGITVAGIGGLLCMIGAVYFGYSNFSTQTGSYFLLATVFTNIVVLYYAFRSKTWKRFGLESEIDGKNISFDTDKIQIGDSGECLTRMNPMGKVMVNDVICEGKTLGVYLEPNTKITVIKVNNNQLVVKPINE